MATTQVQEEVGERKEDEDKTTTPKKEKEEEGDECPICLEELPKDATQFDRFTCCGNGIHIHCGQDLRSMKMSGTCPFCRAKTAKTVEESVKYLRPWVKKKKAWAQAHMGKHYINGEGVKQSYEMARMLFELAAQQGHVCAMVNLGDMYHKGVGVEQQSYEKAFEYYEQAAHLGHDHAQYSLGCCYANGEGVEQNMAAAKEWAEKSAAQGHKNAIAILKRLKN
jgi:TPR repeat protein